MSFFKFEKKYLTCNTTNKELLVEHLLSAQGPVIHPQGGHQG